MVKKFLSFCLIFSQIALAGYLTYDDTGRFYLTLSADERYIYLWQLNGQLASAKFPYALPDDARLLVEPYFEDIDGDGSLEIAAVYQDKNGKYYKLALRQNGEIFDERNWPRQIDNPGQPPVIVPIEDENLLTLDGRDIYNQKYNYYQGLFRHVLYEENGPAPQNLAEIYSRQPTHDLVLSNTDTDFERYLLLVRRDAREKYNFFAELASPNTEITLSLNYDEGIYPWTLLTYDWLNNYTAQEILYYYDHTPPDYAEPAADRQIYFSPNDDGRQDTLAVETTPSDNLYYTQTALLDIFDGPVLVNTLKLSGLTFQRLELNWDGRAAEGRICPDKEYQGIFYIADGCGNISRMTTLNIFLDTQPPQIQQRIKNSRYFTPNGDGQLETFSLTLNISEPVRLEMNIYNLYGRQIKTFAPAEYQENFALVWDGLDNDGIIENGEYNYEIILTDRAGNILISERDSVFLDYKSPLAVNVGPEQTTYNFNEAGVTFNFDALEPLEIALYILNTSGEIIATVNSGLSAPSGSHSFNWNGRLNDAPLPDGVYNYRLVARNAYGNTNAVSGVFYADSNLPGNDQTTVNVYVKTLNPPEPRYISANAEVKYAVNAGEYALKPESGLSLMAVKNIGYITSRIVAEDGAEITRLAQDELIPAGSREFHYRPADGPNGRYYFLTEIKDLQNKPAAMFSREEFILDTEPPVINGLRGLNTQNEIYLATKNIDLEIHVTDNLLPVTEIAFSPDGQNWSVPKVYAEQRNYAVTPTDGAQTVYARVKDAAGNWSETAALSIIVDTLPPEHLGIMINGALSDTAGTLNVSLNFSAADPQGVATMQISYGDAYSWAEYPYGVTLHYQLDPAANRNDFYLKYTDTLGNESGIYHDVIFLDRAPPYNLQARLLSPYYTNTGNILLSVSAEDDLTGVDRIGLSNDELATITVLPYTPSENYIWPLSAGEGEKILTVVAYDRVDNRSRAVTLSCYYDSSPPEIVSSTVVVEPVYLPTLREPLRVSVTANEPVQVLLSVRRDGELVYQTAPAEVTANEQAAYAEYKPELSFGWAGQNNSRHYLRGGATYNIEYQIVDRAGNPGAGGSEEIYLGTSYELVSANYDLTLPAIQATSQNITVEYEDDAGGSIVLLSYDKKDRDNGDIEGGLHESRELWLTFTRSCYVDAYAHTNSSFSRGGVWFDIYGFLEFSSRWITEDIWAGNNVGVFSVPLKFPAGLLRTHMHVDCQNDSWLVGVMRISAKKIRANTYTPDFALTDSYRGNYDSSDQKVRFAIYDKLDPNNQGSMGNLANTYAVTANNGNIYLSRNGVTVNVTKYAADSGVETAEPSMYIVKNIGDRELTGASEYNAMENVHIVWQQKNTPAGKWQIYYAVVPFLSEELPDGGFSIMSLPSAPRTTSAPPPSGQKHFIENVLNYPNPFADETTLTYELGGYSSEVRARIYTITGRLARTLDGLPGAAGYNEYKFDGNDSRGQPLANDVYYLVLLARDERGRQVKARSKIVRLR